MARYFPNARQSGHSVACITISQRPPTRASAATTSVVQSGLAWNQRAIMAGSIHASKRNSALARNTCRTTRTTSASRGIALLRHVVGPHEGVQLGEAGAPV